MLDDNMENLNLSGLPDLPRMQSFVDSMADEICEAFWRRMQAEVVLIENAKPMYYIRHPKTEGNFYAN